DAGGAPAPRPFRLYRIFAQVRLAKMYRFGKTFGMWQAQSRRGSNFSAPTRRTGEVWTDDEQVPRVLPAPINSPGTAFHALDSQPLGLSQPRSNWRRTMESIRLASADSIFPKIPCCRCADQSRYWDRIAGKTYCPNCLEALALGEADPLIVRTERKRCAVCHHLGAVRYVTFPLH